MQEREVRAEKPKRQTVKDLRNLRNELEAMHVQLNDQLFELAILTNNLILDTDDAARTNEGQLVHLDLEGEVTYSTVMDESGTEYTSRILAKAIEDMVDARREFKTFKSVTAELLEEVNYASWSHNCFKTPYQPLLTSLEGNCTGGGHR